MAIAGNASLDEARRAIQDVRYDDARRLLVTALAAGSNGPDELVEIYRLSAATAAVLGDEPLAIKYYERMLAIDPSASLPPNTSPKLRDPFVAAQAHMAALPRVDARVARTATGIAVTVTDPLAMISAVSVHEHGVTRAPIGYKGEPVAIDGPAIDEVILLDDRGNRARIIAVASAATAPASSIPFARRWIVWAVPSAVALGVAVGFSIAWHRARTDLADDIDNSAMHHLDDATTAYARERFDAAGADVAFATAGALAVTAAIVAVVRPRASLTLQPTVSRDRPGLAIAGRF